MQRVNVFIPSCRVLLEPLKALTGWRWRDALDKWPVHRQGYDCTHTRPYTPTDYLVVWGGVFHPLYLQQVKVHYVIIPGTQALFTDCRFVVTELICIGYAALPNKEDVHDREDEVVRRAMMCCAETVTLRKDGRSSWRQQIWDGNENVGGKCTISCTHCGCWYWLDMCGGGRRSLSRCICSSSH